MFLHIYAVNIVRHQQHYIWGTKTYASARDACPSFQNHRIVNNHFHTYKQCFREEQIVYLCDRCVLPSDEHKALPLLIENDLQSTGSDSFLQRFLLALLAAGELSSNMSAENPLQIHHIWKIHSKIAIKPKNVISFFLSQLSERTSKMQQNP